jgi:hypothetical protein
MIEGIFAVPADIFDTALGLCAYLPFCCKAFVFELVFRDTGSANTQSQNAQRFAQDGVLKIRLFCSQDAAEHLRGR